MTILFILSKAREYQLSQILILLDSLEVVRAIEGKGEDWVLRSYVADIMDLAKFFASIKLRYFLRT